MRVIRQDWIVRQNLRDNRSYLYIFGDNLERTGFGGQAKEMRGEPNAFGIATKRKADHGNENCYMHDNEMDAWQAVKSDFTKLQSVAGNYEAIVVPSAGIGTGLAELQDRAPELLKLIDIMLDDLENL